MSLNGYISSLASIHSELIKKARYNSVYRNFQSFAFRRNSASHLPSFQSFFMPEKGFFLHQVSKIASDIKIPTVKFRKFVRKQNSPEILILMWKFTQRHEHKITFKTRSSNLYKISNFIYTQEIKLFSIVPTKEIKILMSNTKGNFIFERIQRKRYP